MSTMLERYLEKEYGIKVSTIRQGLVTSVGTTATRVFRRNPNRIMFLLINLSTNTVYVAFDGTVTTTNGIALDPSGGQMGSWIREDAALTQEEVWIIASGAASAIYAIEVVGIE